MPQKIRQDNLFAAETYVRKYTNFANVDLKSYDFDSLRSAMVSYLQKKYPDQFNDYVVSSEFITLMDLVAFMGHAMAFRVDLSARENFLDTAAKEASVLRLSRFLGYQPRRSISASGLLKIDSVRTNQTIYDSSETNLANTTVSWGATANADLEKFLYILNSALSAGNQFGTPVKSATVETVPTDIYNFNNVAQQNIVYSYERKINNTSVSIEIVPSDISTENKIVEIYPNPTRNFTLVYRNDGLGNASVNNGFFLLFKQGTLSYDDYYIDDRLINRIIDIDTENIDNSDIWIQTIDEDGLVVSLWNEVTNVNSYTTMNESIKNNNRQNYEVINRENGTVSIKFGDGVYSDAPIGTLRVWYRANSGEADAVQTEEMQNIVMDVAYIGRDNLQYTLSITCSLKENVTNAQAAETMNDVRNNAPIKYHSQDRMVTSQDYSVYPLIKNTNALKIRSVNRTFSGHSRFFNISDPTGQHSDLKLFGDDGVLYKRNSFSRKTIPLPTTLSNQEILQQYISSEVSTQGVTNFYYENYADRWITYDYLSDGASPIDPTQALVWKRATSTSKTCTGYFTISDIVQELGITSETDTKFIKTGALIEFVADPFTGVSTTTWASILNVYGDGRGITDNNLIYTGKRPDNFGAIALSKNIKDGSRIKRIIPVFNNSFSATEENNVVTALDQNRSFGIRFNYTTSAWEIIASTYLGADLNKAFDYDTKDTTQLNADYSYILRADYFGTQWIIRTKITEYVFESPDEVRFYNTDTGEKRFDKSTAKPSTDLITILENNIVGAGTALQADINFNVNNFITYDDGYADPSKVVVTSSDINLDFVPDNPFGFTEIVGTNYVALQQQEKDNQDIEVILDKAVEYVTVLPTSSIVADTLYCIINSDGTTTISEYVDDVWVEYDDTEILSGIRKMRFKWNHKATVDSSIDPAISNIVDIFVLTRDYNTEFRNWLALTVKSPVPPQPPSTSDLNNDFNLITENKMASDTIVYRPAKYVVLFGSEADAALQAKFLVVKGTDSILTDNEIKSRVISNTDVFFDIENWDFGETFYFTELASYIHSQLVGNIQSIVLVPQYENSRFGNLFQITPNENELFVSSAKVADVQVVNEFNNTNLRIDQV